MGSLEISKKVEKVCKLINKARSKCNTAEQRDKIILKYCEKYKISEQHIRAVLFSEVHRKFFRNF